MAKQISMIKFTGKLGEMVGQKDAYGKAIIRQRVENPKNPKTTAQAGQRYKLLPAQRIASALKEIVERGQQGVKYGLESRNLFMKRALKMAQGFPFMEKDDPNTIPGEYQLTKGTLPEVKLTLVGGQFQTTLSVNFGDGVNNLGEFSAALIANNDWLLEGDQFTIVAFVNSGGIIVPKYKSLILDTESTESEVFNDFFDGAWVLSDANGYLCINETIAAAVIISRANGANGYLRSNATLAVDKTNAAISKYFTTTGRSDALKTYEGDTSVTNNTNWPVDIDGDGGTSGGGGSAATRGLYTLTAADLKSSSSAAAGKKILMGFENGVPTAVYYTKAENDDNMLHWYCCDLAGEHVTYGDVAEPDTIVLGSLADSFYQSLRKVEYA